MNSKTFSALVVDTKPVIERIIDACLTMKIDPATAEHSIYNLAVATGCIPNEPGEVRRFANYISYISKVCNPYKMESAFDELRRFYQNYRDIFPLEWVPHQLRTLHPGFSPSKEIEIVIEI